MKRSLKIVGMVLGVLLVLVAGLAIYLKSLDFNDYKPQLQQAVREATGRTLKIDGRLVLNLSLRPSLSVDGLHLGNAAWASRKNMINVQRLEVRVRLLPLLAGQLVIERIMLLQPEIALETNASGEGNWEFPIPGAEAGAVAGTGFDSVEKTGTDALISMLTWPQVENFLLRDARFSYRDGKSGKHWQLNIPSARLNGDISRAETPLYFSLQTRIAGIRLLHDAPLNIHARLVTDEHGLVVEHIKVAVAGIDISGNARFLLDRDKPYIEAALTSKQVDVGKWLPEETTKSAKTDEQARRLFPTRRLDLSALRTVNARVTWKVGKLSAVDVGVPKLSQVNMMLALDQGVLVIKVLRARLAGGDLLGKLGLDAAAPSVKFDASVRAKDILVGRLLNNDGESMLEKGPLKMRIALDGEGASVAEIMAHLNGRIRLSMGEARVKTSALNLIGGDLLVSLFNKLNPFSDSPPYTKVKCGVVHFRVENGLMLSENGIAFETARMNLLSHGQINLHDESIDLSIGTEPREGLGLNISNMVNVVKLGGTLAEPSLAVDAGKTDKAAARVAGAVVTGGLSLLGEGLFNRLTADSSPCQTALEMQ